MLTEKTLFAIDLLNMVNNSDKKEGACIEKIAKQCNHEVGVVRSMLDKFAEADWVQLVNSDKGCFVFKKTLREISLLELLLLLDEELEVLHPKNKGVVKRLGSSKIGIVFTTIDTFVKMRLSEIKITDIPVK